MYRKLIAALLLAAPAAAASGQAEDRGAWALATMTNGCMVQAVSPAGTMLSIWGFAGEEKLGFLLQNRGWTLREGQSYDLEVEFLGARSWPVEATGREHIDSDGPGFFFTLQPGAAGASGFLDSFTSAEGMRILTGGESVDTLPLAGSRGAMASLARCLAERWNSAPAAAPGGGEPKDPAPEDETI